MAREFKTKVEKQDAFCRSLIADPDTDLGLDPSWVGIYPYQSLAKPGKRVHSKFECAIIASVRLPFRYPLFYRPDGRFAPRSLG